MEESRQPQKIVTFKVSPEKFASILNKPPNPSFHRNAPRTTRIASPKASSANLASIISNNSKRPHDSQPHEPPRKVTVLSVSPARLASITNTPPPRPDALPSSLTPYLAPLGRTIRDTREGARARAQAISARERFGGTRHMLEIYQRHADPDDPDDPWSQYLFDQDYTYVSDSDSDQDGAPVGSGPASATPTPTPATSTATATATATATETASPSTATSNKRSRSSSSSPSPSPSPSSKS